MSNMIVELDGKRYVWTGDSWYAECNYLTPPLDKIQRLNTLIANRLAAEDDRVSDADALLRLARQAHETDGQLDRAHRLAHRAHALRPDHAGTAAVLCSILRDLGRPSEALSVADPFRRTGYRPVLTSRAAALCDLGHWDDALRQIRQVFAIGRGKGSRESLAVYGRIKANAPGLIAESV
jgi:tetratricopeptide (TPR) repeat protein